jgi:hypothetical protein
MGHGETLREVEMEFCTILRERWTACKLDEEGYVEEEGLNRRIYEKNRLTVFGRTWRDVLELLDTGIF